MKIQKPEDLLKEYEELRKKAAILAVSNIIIIKRLKIVIEAGNLERAKSIQKLQAEVEAELTDAVVRFKVIEKILEDLDNSEDEN